MNPSPISQSVVEEAVLSWFQDVGYPPDRQEQATQTVLEQAASLSQEWAVA